jgi:predicted small secreted protein
MMQYALACIAVGLVCAMLAACLGVSNLLRGLFGRRER